MKAKRWIVREHDAERAASLARVLGVSPILAALLITRGYADERAARVFLSPTYDQLHEPYSMLGMKEAVARLQKAINTGERVLIYGDYDVDGTTGTAILLRALKLLNANVGFHIPHRFTEGYGIQQAALEQAVADGYTLVVSVDCAFALTNHSTGHVTTAST
jgi:single-stranded-DNA-specific exonuclease